MASDAPQNEPQDDREEPVSLYPLSPEEALKRALNTPPPRKDTHSGEDSESE